MSDVKNQETEAQRLLSHRLSSAHAFISLYIKAYDALLFHRVNFRDLKEYKDTSLLDRAKKASSETARVLHIDWCKKVESGIAARIARTNFREVTE